MEPSQNRFPSYVFVQTLPTSGIAAFYFLCVILIDGSKQSIEVNKTPQVP